MQYQLFDDTYVLRLDKGDKIAASLLSFAAQTGVQLASVTGIGAVDEMEVGVFDLAESNYHRIAYGGNHEINALVGNLSTKDGRPYVHLHITATGLDGKVVGGHLFEATVSLTAEIFVHALDGVVERQYDPSLGINRLSFDR